MANFDNLINDNQTTNTIGGNPDPVVQETYIQMTMWSQIAP